MMFKLLFLIAPMALTTFSCKKRNLNQTAAVKSLSIEQIQNQDAELETFRVNSEKKVPPLFKDQAPLLGLKLELPWFQMFKDRKSGTLTTEQVKEKKYPGKLTYKETSG